MAKANMRVVALISGGKDSCFNMMHVVAEGHEVVALANLYPDSSDKDELDSYMYQTVGHEAIDMYSEAMDLPLFRRKISGTSKILDLDYTPDEKDEVEDLYELLKEIQKSVPFDAVSSGAILSDYQRIRVESVCTRLGLTSLAYLWRRNQEELLKEMIDSELEAVIIKTAALGLKPRKHLGKTLAEMSETLHCLKEKYGCHVCGEGGEFETFTLDCPLFKKKIVIDESEIMMLSDDSIAPVGYLKLKKMHLEPKSLPDYNVKDWSLTTSSKWVKKILSNIKHITCIEEDYISQQEVKRLVVSKTDNCMIQPFLMPSMNCHQDFLTVSNLQGVTNGEDSYEDIENETHRVLVKLRNILQEHSHTLENICYVQIYVSNMSLYKYINNVYSKFFSHNPPARACIGCINNLKNSDKKILLQLYCISNKIRSRKKSMHVQGISHWAPANIGPFSQCVLVDNLLFVSGTIALIPGNMEIIEGGAEAQAHTSLHHVESVTLAMANTRLKNFLQAICYVVNSEQIESCKHAWTKAINTEDVHDACTPVYLTVNQLPKGALVEWQGVAAVYEDDGEVECKKGSTEYDNIKIDWNYTTARNSTHISYAFTLSLGIDANHLNDGCEPDTKKLISYFQQCLSDLLDKCSLNNSCIIQASLFYAGTSLLADTTQDTLSENFEDIPISIVQVNAISGKNTNTPMTLTCLCTTKLCE